MLFNSLPFMLLVSIVVLLVFNLRRLSLPAPKYFLILVSLGFYTLWNPSDLPVLLASLLGNWLFASRLNQSQGLLRRLILILAIVSNLALLLSFKVGPVLSQAVNDWWPELPVIAERTLPLGISFFTFQQVAYLVAIYRHNSPVKIADYSFVITFFPHLIAGPLVRHSDMIRQLNRPSTFSFRSANLFGGVGLFIIGLSKKVLLADPLGNFSHRLFAIADSGQSMDMLYAWIAALSGFLNFYFDFSGYSDMACGIALIIGIRLPLNFYSPLKAVTMDEFWGRWNITVTQFIREHVFRPLAGKRLVIRRHLAALPVTMIVAGFWHGASLNFLLWGALHGLVVTLQHTRRLVFRMPGSRKMSQGGRLLSWGHTQFMLIALGCIFQAHSIEGAWIILRGMVGLGGAVESVELVSNFHPTWSNGLLMLLGYSSGGAAQELLIVFEALLLIGVAWAISLFAPNSIQIMRRFRPVVDSTRLLRKGASAQSSASSRFMATPSLAWSLAFAGLLALTLLRVLSNAPSPFNYYNY